MNDFFRDEIKPLTGLRGVAAVIVMVYHFGQPYQRLDVNTHFRVAHGYLAVDAFYVLSGFVLALAYGEEFRAGATLNKLKRFVIRRVARLYPAYLAAMLLFLIKMSANFAGDNPFKAFRPVDIPGNLLMMTGWGLNIVPLVADSWSVSAEFVCYLIFPLLVPFAVPGTLPWRVVAASCSFFGLVAVTVLGHGVKGPLDVVMQDSFYPLIRCLCGFTIGLVTFRTWRISSVRLFFSSELSFPLIFLAFVVLLQIGASDLLLYACIVSTVLALASGAIISQILFANPVVIFLGEISYSLYLCHDIFVTISVRVAHILSLQLAGRQLYPVVAVCGVVAALCFAQLSYRWIEIPGRRLILASFGALEGRQ